MIVRSIVKTLGTLTFCATLVGCSCAKKDDLDALQAETRKSLDQCHADTAKALKAAEQAEERSMKTEESVNRCFKKSMRK